MSEESRSLPETIIWVGLIAFFAFAMLAVGSYALMGLAALGGSYMALHFATAGHVFVGGAFVSLIVFALLLMLLAVSGRRE